jgi:ankyrin repeat protein
MDPVTILSVVATSSKLAKTAWDLGEALYTFTKSARVVNKTLAALTQQTKAIIYPCELLAVFLEGVKYDIERHPDWAATQHGMQLDSTFLVVQHQLQGCNDTLELLCRSTEGIRCDDSSSAKRAWATFNLNLQRDHMQECRSQLSMHLIALNTSLHILTGKRLPFEYVETRDADSPSNITYLAREPEQPLEDLREEIEALREQTIELEMQKSVLSDSPEHSQLLALARDTVADGETVYAQSVVGGSVFGDSLEASFGQQASLSAWVHQQAFEASQRSLGPVMEADSLATEPPVSDDVIIRDADQAQQDHDHTSKDLGETDGELDFKHNVINSLIELARVSFGAENYQDSKMKLQAAIATIRDLPSDSRSIYDFFEIQYKLAVAMFYSTERKSAQRFLLDFARQQPSTDEQRYHIAHASRLLAETYISTGNLAAAKSSCSNAIRIHQRLSGEDSGSQDYCFALAARIEVLLGNQDKADAYTYNIASANQAACMKRYTTTVPENSLSVEKRHALFSAEASLFQGYSFYRGSGDVWPHLKNENSMHHFEERLSPLHIAAMFGDVGEVLVLIENGADVNAGGPIMTHLSLDQITLTPLMCSLISHHEDMVRTLVSKGARLSIGDDPMIHSLVLALAFRWPVMPDYASDDYSMIACVRYLGCDINSPVNSRGDSMLHIAAKCGAIDLAQALMAHGLEPLTINFSGEIALHKACGPLISMDAFIGLASALLQSKPSDQLESEDKSGRTALHVALWGSDLEESIRKAQYLITRGSVLAKDKAGNIPLTLAIINGVGVLGVRTLLSSHKNDQLSSRNLKLQTPLQVALAKRKPDVLAELLRAGAHPYEEDSTGKTAVKAIVELYKPEDFTPLERQTWREVWNELRGWSDAREAVDQLEKRDRDFDKELLHPRTTKFLKSPIWSPKKVRTSDVSRAQIAT